MILTLVWKEFREHRSIWLTMVIMTGLLTFGLAQIVSPGDDVSRLAMPAIAVLGLAAAYGVVCGSMMFAGEWEAGTMVFLDIFLGRRGWLWLWKCLIGAVLALSEGLAVGLLLDYLKIAPPEWLPMFIGQGRSLMPEPGRHRPALDSLLWIRVLPVVTLEAFAWGLLGSALTRFVLTGAALAALIAAPLYLVAILSPPEVSLGIRLVTEGLALVISCSVFLSQAREPSSGSLLQPPETPRQIPWVLLDEDIDAPAWERRPSPELRLPAEEARRDPEVLVRRGPRPANADSPWQVLWWLTLRQAALPFGILAGVGFIIGFFVPSHGQVLWPIATLLLGVACGTATFANEQSDRSYQFLAAQHFPLTTVWRVKILFWLGAAAVGLLILALASGLVVLAEFMQPRRLDAAGRLHSGVRFGTLRELMGPLLFFGIWLAYGFAVGQISVLLCRKAILAVLLAGMVSAAALGLWLPSLLCRGMNGWQLWLPPLAMLAATWCLMRAWAGDRIKERRPLAALIGFGLAALAWTAINLGHRAWEVPDASEPLDRAAFAASIPSGKDNLAGQKFQAALADFEDGPWLARIADAAALPTGVIEYPPADGPSPVPRHLATCRHMTDRLWGLASRELEQGNTAAAVQHLAQILALSRNLRNKAPLSSYLRGVEIEERALDALESFLSRGKGGADLLRRMLDELNRHAAETPPPLDCVKTECFRAGGVLRNPTSWTFYSGREDSARVPETWLAGSIALSLELPWEQERKVRLWRTVWQGLFHGTQTPHWELPETPAELGNFKETTRQILRGWLPVGDGTEAAVTVVQLARLLDRSWLADERLFVPVEPLRSVATRARWHVDSCRLQLALGLYQIEKKKPAAKLQDLVPKFLTELPVDPYSGRMFGYRLSGGEDIVTGNDGIIMARVHAGQGILWSTGPDRIDHGGRRHGGPEDDRSLAWQNSQLDLVTIVPRWP